MPEQSNFKLIIEDDEGRRSVVPVDLGEVSIGRLEGNTIRLNERNVSRRHARLFQDGGPIVAEDLDSYNGVFINGDRIKGRHELKDGDLIRIGDFQLELRGEGLKRRTEETTQRTLVPDMEATQPEIRVETTQPAVPAPAEGESSEVPARAERPEPEQRAEPTAIIRMSHLEDVEASRRGARALAGQKAKLVCVSTQFAGQEFEIEKTEVVVGRTDDNDIAIDHRSVSRHHAKIMVAGRNFKVIDLKSANGTLVNGEEYAQADLKSGDLVELGHVKFRFVPPGEDYAFTSEEAAAIQARDPQRVAPAGAPLGRGAAPVGQPVVGLLKANPLLAMAIAGLTLLIAIMLIWMISSTGDRSAVAEPTDEPVPAAPEGTVAAVETGSDVGGLLTRANAAMAERQWPKARDLARAALVMHPGHAQAQRIAGRADKEAEAQQHYDAAIAYVNDSKWTDAWNHLQQIEAPSAYYTESRSLMDPVRAALITKRVAQADRALKEQDWDTALAQADEIASLDAERPDVGRIQAAAKEGKRKRVVAAAASKRPKTPRVKTSTKPKPPPPPPAAAGEDADEAYAAGTKALKAENYQKAIEHFSRCIKAERRALCYRAMGIAYAKAGNGPKAYRYYKQYLKVAPDAPDAPAVRKLLQQYEQAQ